MTQIFGRGSELAVDRCTRLDCQVHIFDSVMTRSGLSGDNAAGLDITFKGAVTVKRDCPDVADDFSGLTENEMISFGDIAIGD
ncbi:hypothetical protein [Desulfoprunum benzoelyticum]|nr:hypothetical protein [Desulfoprunum benzoelyticum]